MAQLNPEEIKNLWLHKNIKRNIPNNTGHSGFGLNNPNYAINMYDWLKDALDLLGIGYPATITNSFVRIEQMGDYVEATSPTDTLYLLPGSNISLDYDTGASSITINSTGAANSFGYISVDGQDDVVADQPDDQLVLEGIEGIAITTDAANDKVTFALSIAPALYSFKTIYPSLGDPVIAETAEAAYQLYGTGLTTTTGDNTTKTITIDTPIQNIFNTISVAGQDDVVADSGTDILTLVAGTNMTITTDETTDTITFTSAGGADTNIYNSDGNLTGNRTLGFNGYNLDFEYDSAGDLDVAFHTDIFSAGIGLTANNDRANLSISSIGTGVLDIGREGTGWISRIQMLSPSGNDPNIGIEVANSTYSTSILQDLTSLNLSANDGVNGMQMQLISDGDGQAAFSWATGLGVQAVIGIDTTLNGIFWTKVPLYNATHEVGMVLSATSAGSSQAPASPTFPIRWVDLRFGADSSSVLNVGDNTVGRYVTDGAGSAQRLVSVLVSIPFTGGMSETIELAVRDETGTSL